MTKLLLLFSFPALFTACSGASTTDNDVTEVTTTEDLYSLALDVQIDTDEDEAFFITPTAASYSLDAQDIIGKPWYVGFFEAGALTGVDQAIVDDWGTVDETLSFSYTTPALFESGPYDAIFIIYVNREITEEDKAGEFSPLAVTGDLSSFTLADQALTEDDPELSVAYLRLHVDGADGGMAIRNKTPTDWLDADQLLDAFIDTLMVVP